MGYTAGFSALKMFYWQSAIDVLKGQSHENGTFFNSINSNKFFPYVFW